MRQLIIVVGLLVVTLFVFARHVEGASGERFINELANEDEVVDNSARQVNWKKALPMMKKGNFRGNQGYYGARSRYAGRSAPFDSDEDQDSDRRR